MEKSCEGYELLKDEEQVEINQLIDWDMVDEMEDASEYFNHIYGHNDISIPAWITETKKRITEWRV